MIAAERYSSLGSLLWDALVQFKSQTALIEAKRKSESARLSYRELWQVARSQASFFEELGIGPGDRVAVVLTNQWRYLATAIAAFFRGAVVVPIDYKLTLPEQQALLGHCSPALWVTEAAYLRGLEVLPAPVVLVTEASGMELPVGALPWEAGLEREPVSQPVGRSRADLATIVYSSGTGGDPKGCMLSHGAYLTQLRGLLDLYPMEPGESFFSVLPTNHAIDFMTGFVAPLCCGATVVHQRTLRPELLRWTMQRYGITHMAAVPMLLKAFKRAIEEKLDDTPDWQRSVLDGLMQLNRALTDRKPRPSVSQRLLKSVHQGFGGKLKLVFSGGTFVEPSLAEYFYDLGIPVVVGYGLTEACTVVTVHRLEPWRADGVGKPVRDVQVRIDAPDEAGVGEVQVRGGTLMSGYLDDEAQTSDSYTADGWLKTGDLGYLDASNHLHLVGRAKNLIVTEGGKNVYPEDIEGAFSELDCEELCVFAANYIWPKRTLVNEILVVVVRELSDRDALRRMNRKLADYKRVAGVVHWGDEFPRTASMKVKRARLAEQLREALDASAVEAL